MKRWRPEAQQCTRGLTLVELMLVVLLIGIIVVVAAPLIRVAREGWEAGERRSDVIQNARIGMEQCLRILRQAQRIRDVSGPDDGTGFIQFTDAEGITREFRLNSATKNLEYGSPGSLSPLAGPLKSLTFKSYDANTDLLSDPVPANKVQSLWIRAVFSDAEGKISKMTFTSYVCIRKDAGKTIVINEIMYNPPSSQGPDLYYEWIELHNPTGSPIDLSGWQLWTAGQSSPDIIEGDSIHGTGSTVIPAEGYAVVTDMDTNVYTELITNGGFESSDTSAWINPESAWSRTSGGAHSGNYKFERTASGWANLFQEITLPSGNAYVSFSFWEKTNVNPVQTRLTATIRNTSDQVLETLYDGRFAADWTEHTADLSAYAGQTIRVFFRSRRSGRRGSCFLDDVSVVSTYVEPSAVRLRVDDNDIGQGLKNDADTINIGDGTDTVDSVSYEDSWGADGNGKTLSRIDPAGDSNDPANWQEGPVNGTPGSAN